MNNTPLFSNLQPFCFVDIKDIKKENGWKIKTEPMSSETNGYSTEEYFDTDDDSQKTVEATEMAVKQEDMEVGEPQFEDECDSDSTVEADEGTQITKDYNHEQMSKFGLTECSVLMDNVLIHYQCASSVAFAKPPASSGIIIKCLLGCDFYGLFKSFKTMHQLINQHFEEKHPRNKWAGFCSRCERFVFVIDNRKTRKRVLTIKDELLHIENCHTTKNGAGRA